MGRPRIVEKNFHDFKGALRSAIESGNRIEPQEKQNWSAWVKQHRVKEAAFKSIGTKQYDGMKAVIIDGDDAWSGYYLYSSVDEVALKWEREPD